MLSGSRQELPTTFAKYVLPFSQPVAATRGTSYICAVRQYFEHGFYNHKMCQFVECICLAITLGQWGFPGNISASMFISYPTSSIGLEVNFNAH
jgi:hypothetical protein